MFLKSIKLHNFLSFGDPAEEVSLESLNVIIGTNAAGKSNLIKVLKFLPLFHKYNLVPSHANNLLWQGVDENGITEIEIVLNTKGQTILSTEHKFEHNLRYVLKFKNGDIIEERVESEYLASEFLPGSPRGLIVYCHYKDGKAIFNEGTDKEYELDEEYIDSDRSILAQFQSPKELPELTHIANALERIAIYDDWAFGNNSEVRSDQDADMPNKELMPNAKNLTLVLRRLKKDDRAKDILVKNLQLLYDEVLDIDFLDIGEEVRLIMKEKNEEKMYKIPARRLSDGTMRYLALLAILCDPTPPPLICLEEPELGLHPDILPTIAKLMQEASERCQLIVTTHSDVLAAALTHTPNKYVLVAGKDEKGTHFKRLDNEELQNWLEEYGDLGQLWLSGEIGGTA